MVIIPSDGGDVVEWCHFFLKIIRRLYALNIKPPTKQNYRWMPPSLGCFKINMDAAVNIESAAIELGVIVRDSVRCCVGASATL